MARRRLVTLQEIERSRTRGLERLVLPLDAIVTPAARDAARRLGIRLIEASSPERPIHVYGNWKATGSVAHASAFATELLAHPALAGGAAAPLRLALFPPALHIPVLAPFVADTPLALGAQDLDPVEPGAFTGALPPALLADCEVSHVLVGHSERRHVFGEDDALVRRKLAAAIAHGFTAVLCVGETLAQRDAGRTFSVLRWQLLDAIERLEPGAARRLVLAYEPVWAIGTGQRPRAVEIGDALGALRDHLVRHWGEGAGREVPLLYGGSVGPDSAAAILEVPGCDGVLVGGASRRAEAFGAIVQAALTAVQQRR